jgi:phospholipid/cholesterol/gamma-HCH transport system substrate-binding protein
MSFALYYIATLGVRIAPPDDRVNLSMRVADTNGLVVDSNVLLRGVPIGKITKINSSADSAAIDFYIDKEFPIPVDTEVRLENLSALGESYIGLIPRTVSGPMLHDGQEVATEDIKAPASISELTTNLVRVLNQANPDALARVIGEVDRALPDPDAVLPNLERGSRLLKDNVTTMDGRGSQLLANLQTLLQNAGWVGPVMSEMTPSLSQAVDAVSDMLKFGTNFFGGIGAPEIMLVFGNLIARFQKFLDDRGPDLRVIAEALMPNVQGIAAALMNVDTGQMLSNILNGVPEDGVITLRLTVPNP